MAQDVREECNSVHGRIEECMQSFEFAKAINAVFATVDLANSMSTTKNPGRSSKKDEMPKVRRFSIRAWKCSDEPPCISTVYPRTCCCSLASARFDTPINEYQKGSDSHGFLDSHFCRSEGEKRRPDI